MVQAFFFMGALVVEAMRKAIRHRLVVEFIFHIIVCLSMVRVWGTAVKVRNKVILVPNILNMNYICASIRGVLCF